jgi:hypothetical protein
MARQAVTGAQTVTPFDADVVLANAPNGVWLDDAGVNAILVLSGAGSTYQGAASNGDLNLLERDGTLFRVGQGGGLDFNGLGWDGVGDGPMLRHASPNGMGKFTIPALSESGLDTDASRYSGLANWALLSDRYLQFDGNRVRAWPLPSGAASTERVIVSASVGPGGFIFPADLSSGNSLWWCVTPSTGLLYQYDAIAQAEVASMRSGFGSAFTWAAYSRKHDLFAVMRAGALVIYANEPAAASISAPGFGAGPNAGKQTALSSTLIGSENEPCAGRLVTLSVDAGGLSPTEDGDGASSVTVETDASGVASATFLAPYAASSGHTATAELVE